MNGHKNKNLAAKILLSSSLLWGAFQAHGTGIPVVDALNVSQNVLNTIEAVAHTAKQIQQYQTQLQQYQNMLQNTAAPPSFVWDQAQGTIDNLLRSIDTINQHKSTLGSLTKYTDQFQSTDYYLSTPCFSNGNCTPAEIEKINKRQRAISHAQKTANDASLRGLDTQQQTLTADAAQLQTLQSAAQGASGQLAAIGYANQLASHQSNQLLQIRALLIAQQNTIVTRNQAVADREARMQAASERMRRATFTASPRVEMKVQ